MTDQTKQEPTTTYADHYTRIRGVAHVLQLFGERLALFSRELVEGQSPSRFVDDVLVDQQLQAFLAHCGEMQATANMLYLLMRDLMEVRGIEIHLTVELPDEVEIKDQMVVADGHDVGFSIQIDKARLNPTQSAIVDPRGLPIVTKTRPEEPPAPPEPPAPRGGRGERKRAAKARALKKEDLN